MSKMIHLCLAKMSETGMEQKYIQEAFDTQWVAPLGPNVNAFEKDLEQFVCEGKRVVALSNGTAAVHLALIACGVGPGDEVIVQSFTFCASSHPVTYLGATPVFVDSEPETWNIDPDLLEEAIKDRIAKTGKKPKAIVPVALYGMPYDLDRIMDIANRYEIPVIEDAAEGFGSRYKGQVLGTAGRYGVLSFNGNKMITTSGGGALICKDKTDWDKIMWLATQARESYPYYQHETIGYNYRMSNICAGIGRGQMTVLNAHIAHHHHVQALYEQLLADVPGITVHTQPDTLCHFEQASCHFEQPTCHVERSRDISEISPCASLSRDDKGNMVSRNDMGNSRDDKPIYDSNYWLTTITLDPSLKVKGQENAYKQIITSAVGGAAGVIHTASTAVTDCQPNDNVEAMRLALLAAGIESRPLWKPMHKQPVYRHSPAYVNGVSEGLFKVGMCLPTGPCVTDEQVAYIVNAIKDNIL
ncbi:DegT/DnrJ/EryC1/StrS family aminotransferase [Prevotella sp. ne3005]|uniref:DegT/DnrJ/EryC1/StrS family aminotransferase n=1 Tax=Prevotella sp. ne3005 TaxID=1761887 RepID=UPI001FCD5ED7|nr:DegT/DnrJ/EryC1/StrS family aminotransferase [Prevotella sp. ne3005]